MIPSCTAGGGCQARRSGDILAVCNLMIRELFSRLPAKQFRTDHCAFELANLSQIASLNGGSMFGNKIGMLRYCALVLDCEALAF
jgi:hypothetical protein